MRNQKVSAEPVKQPNPLNKMRKAAPQIQPGVTPKAQDKQFNVDAGKQALRNMFANARKRRM